MSEVGHVAERSKGHDPSGGRTWNERDRLAALLRYGILDTPPEPDFDNITRVASLVCKAPISVINLIADTRQWFKSEIGLGVRETPLDVSICAKAILQPDTLVVPDLTADSRFDCNPLVAGEPHLRFYAGARIDTPEGLPLGTVCVLDYEPRPQGIPEEQREVLRALARQTMAHLELKRAVEERELLARELSHRIKNIFAIVSGLAASSARRDPAARSFAATFGERINALARANDYVLPRSSRSGSEHENTVLGLIRTLLLPYQEGNQRIIVDGDDAPLATAASTLALIIHELATNAVKYGALSNEQGSLHIRGAIEGPAYVLSWLERGGPAVPAPPRESGFGTLMVDRSVRSQFGGTLTREWTSGGLETRISIPLESLGR